MASPLFRHVRGERLLIEKRFTVNTHTRVYVCVFAARCAPAFPSRVVSRSRLFSGCVCIHTIGRTTWKRKTRFLSRVGANRQKVPSSPRRSFPGARFVVRRISESTLPVVVVVVGGRRRLRGGQRNVRFFSFENTAWPIYTCCIMPSPPHRVNREGVFCRRVDFFFPQILYRITIGRTTRLSCRRGNTKTRRKGTKKKKKLPFHNTYYDA